MNNNNNNYEIITSFKRWIDSFKNKNTGNEYEISTGLSILLGSNLSKDEYLPEKYKNIEPCIVYQDIKGIINYTQDDSIGTGDIGIVLNDGSIKTFSVTKNRRSVSKCIRNPSGIKTYGMEKNDELKKKSDEAFKTAIAMRKETRGNTPNERWKRVRNCPGTIEFCELLAKHASKSWNKQDENKRLEKIKILLDITEENTNACGIIYWDQKKDKIDSIYEWTLRIVLKKYLKTFSDGIYIYHGNSPQDYILKTQVKYNNGIIEGMSSKKNPSDWVLKKSEKYLSSWNCEAPDLFKIFELNKLK